MSTREEYTPPASRDGRRRLAEWAAGVAAALLLAGCQVFPERPPVAATYDLGTGERGSLANALAPARVTVSAPAWLQVTAMHYRDVRGDPGRRRTCADNRWAAQPPAMLRSCLNARWGPARGEVAACRCSSTSSSSSSMAAIAARRAWWRASRCCPCVGASPWPARPLPCWNPRRRRTRAEVPAPSAPPLGDWRMKSRSGWPIPIGRCRADSPAWATAGAEALGAGVDDAPKAASIAASRIPHADQCGAITTRLRPACLAR